MTAAFGQPNEADLVDLIRDRGEALIALVATIEDQPVGYVLASPIHIDQTTGNYLGIAPLAVSP